MRNTQRAIIERSKVFVAPAPPVPGTPAFSKLFIETTGKFEGLKKGLAVYLVDKHNPTTGVQGANHAQVLFNEHGFKLSSGYQTVRKDKKKGLVPSRFTAMEYMIADACAAMETAVTREIEKRTPAPAAAPAAEVVKLDDKGKARTALGDLKSAGITGKAELARIFAELQQACIEQDLDKISILILEGQKILAIAK